MREYHKNPRTITRDQYESLEKSLDRFGDLSGIVHDLNSDEIIGGNQRSRIFELAQNEKSIHLETIYDVPDEQGTVAIGYILWHGHRFHYRQVRWTPDLCEEANVRANHDGGRFDMDKLANEFDLDKLLKWGWKEQEFQIQNIDFNFQPPDSETKGLKQFAVLLAPHQYELVIQMMDRLIENEEIMIPENPHKTGNALFWAISHMET